MKEREREQKIELWKNAWDRKRVSGGISGFLVGMSMVTYARAEKAAESAVELTATIGRLVEAGAVFAGVGSTVLAGVAVVGIVRASHALDALEAHEDAAYEARFAAREPTISDSE